MSKFKFHYSSYSSVLDKWFEDSKVIAAPTQEQAEASFRLFMYSLFSGNWSLRFVQELCS